MKGDFLYYAGAPVKHAKIEATASGNTAIVAAVAATATNPARRIAVLSLSIVAGTAVGVEWRSGTTTVISGKQEYPDAGGIVRAHNPMAWFKTAPGEALNINLDGASQVGGELVYQLIE